MSMLSMRRREPEHTEPPPEYRPPRPQPPGPYQIGDVVVRAVDEMAEAAAAPWDKLAIEVITGAEQVAERCREVARRIRHNGMVENERVANISREAVTVYDAANMLLTRFELRDQLPPEPAPAEVHGPPRPVNLDEIAAQISEVKEEASHDSDG